MAVPHNPFPRRQRQHNAAAARRSDSEDELPLATLALRSIQSAARSASESAAAPPVVRSGSAHAGSGTLPRSSQSAFQTAPATHRQRQRTMTDSIASTQNAPRMLVPHLPDPAPLAAHPPRDGIHQLPRKKRSGILRLSNVSSLHVDSEEPTTIPGSAHAPSTPWFKRIFGRGSASGSPNGVHNAGSPTLARSASPEPDLATCVTAASESAADLHKAARSVEKNPLAGRSSSASGDTLASIGAASSHESINSRLASSRRRTRSAQNLKIGRILSHESSPPPPMPALPAAYAAHDATAARPTAARKGSWLQAIRLTRSTLFRSASQNSNVLNNAHALQQQPTISESPEPISEEQPCPAPKPSVLDPGPASEWAREARFHPASQAAESDASSQTISNNNQETKKEIVIHSNPPIHPSIPAGSTQNAKTATDPTHAHQRMYTPESNPYSQPRSIEGSPRLFRHVPHVSSQEWNFVTRRLQDLCTDLEHDDDFSMIASKWGAQSPDTPSPDDTILVLHE